MKTTFKPRDKVRYKDGDKRIFIVYGVYSKNEVSLGLYKYPDVEQDIITNTSELIKI